MCIIVVEPEVDNNYVYDEMPALIPIHYSPDGRDCTISIHNFKTDEASFYPVMQYYSTTLNHRINGVTLSTCTITYGVIETFRDGEVVNIYYPTIADWIKEYSGIENDIIHILDTVFMGDTSLWDIM